MNLLINLNFLETKVLLMHFEAINCKALFQTTLDVNWSCFVMLNIKIIFIHSWEQFPSFLEFPRKFYRHEIA